ncbi:hypothetical protein, partial [Escherichia coli]|uniref:hypothetical protein n=1 Tax=Escherichia coli TaxID=562 RepID=UPI000B3F0F17
SSWFSPKSSRGKAPKKGRLPEKGGNIHKIPEFVWGNDYFKRRMVSIGKKRKKKKIFLPPFII